MRHKVDLAYIIKCTIFVDGDDEGSWWSVSHQRWVNSITPDVFTTSYDEAQKYADDLIENYPNIYADTFVVTVPLNPNPITKS